MKEIEVKAHLEHRETVMEALRALGCVFSNPVTQDDTLYVRETGSVEQYLSNKDFLRLRVQNDGKVLFTLKHHPGRADDVHDAPLEYETTVGSRDVMEQALLTMGFKEAVRVQKTRVKTKFEKWEICLDEVVGLGSFIELEEMAEAEAEVKSVHDAMLTFLSSLGISGESSNLERYDIMMLKKG